MGCQKSVPRVSGGVITRLWCAVACCRLVGGAGGLVVRRPGAAPPSRVDGALLAVDGCQRGRDPGPPPPAGHHAPPAPTPQAPAPSPRAACGAQPPGAQAAMVDLRGHARDAASLAPPHGAPTLDLPSPTTRPATDSQLGTDLDRTAGHREPALGLPAHPRGTAAPWLPDLGQAPSPGSCAPTASSRHHVELPDPRRGTNTSMTCPNWSSARSSVPPPPGHLHIGLVALLVQGADSRLHVYLQHPSSDRRLHPTRPERSGRGSA